MKTVLKILVPISILLVLLLMGFSSLVWFTTYHPLQLVPVPVYSRGSAPMLQPGQTIKIMT